MMNGSRSKLIEIWRMSPGIVERSNRKEFHPCHRGHNLEMERGIGTRSSREHRDRGHEVGIEIGRREMGKKGIVIVIGQGTRYKRKERKKQWSLEVDPERDSEDWAGKVRDVRLIMESQFKRTFKRSWGISSFYDSIVSAFMAIALSWGQLLLGWTYRPLLTEGLEGCMLATCHFNINTKINLRSGDLNPFGRCGVGAAIAFMMKGGLCKKLLLMIKLEHKMVGQNVGDCDDEEGGGLALNARSRALLIAVIRSLLALPKGTPAPYQQHDPWGPHPFCSSYTWTSSSGPSTSGHLTIPTMDDNWSPKPNQILIWTIKEDVQEGMLNGFGNVKHIYVDKNSAGFVYMRFENMQAAINAQRALHGRWLPPGPTRLSFLTADRS
ncbi:hypothetical protein NC652_010024 [Populus alba x Populus x berolinensis]|nr:hypothetical protein NC652_010024 [Populus alba x Populus x berolinensis]